MDCRRVSQTFCDGKLIFNWLLHNMLVWGVRYVLWCPDSVVSAMLLSVTHIERLETDLNNLQCGDYSGQLSQSTFAAV